MSRPIEEPFPAWRRKIVTASANCAGFVMAMLGFRWRVKGLENYAKGKQLGAVCLTIPPQTEYAAHSLFILSFLVVYSALSFSSQLDIR